MRRALLIPVLVGALGLMAAPAMVAHAGGQNDPGPVNTNVTGSTGPVPTVPSDTTPVTDEGSGTPLPTSAPTTSVAHPVPTLAPECKPPPAPAVVFVGRLTAAAGGVGRFAVEAVRSDPDGIAVIGQFVDVQIGDDLRFLVYDGRYLVAADRGPNGQLHSKVHQPPPLFGGDQVVGVEDFGVKCPALSDPIVVRQSGGGTVDTGVFGGFLDDKRGIALAFAKPAAGVMAVLVGLWVLKYLLIGIGKGLVRLSRRVRRARAERVARRSPFATPAR